MASGKSNTARRREVRRSVPRPASKWSTWLRTREALFSLLYVLLLTTVGSAIVISARAKPDYHLNHALSEAYVARVNFIAVDEDATRKNQNLAWNREPSVYQPNTAYFQQVRDRLDELIRYAADPTVVSTEQLPPQTVATFQLSNEVLTQLRRFVRDGEPTDEWKRRVDEFIDGLASIAVLKSEEFYAERDPLHAPGRIRIRQPRFGDEGFVEKDRYSDVLINVEADLRPLRDRVAVLADQFRAPSQLKASIVAVAMLDPQPTYVRDYELTEQRRTEAYNRVPVVEKRYLANTVLVGAGQKLTQADIDLIHEEHRAVLAEMAPLEFWLPRAATVGLFLLVSLGLWGYIVAYSHRVTRNAMRGLAITALLVLGLGLAVGLTQLGPQYVFLTATAPTLMVATVLAIAYDQRFALALGAFHVLMVMLGLDLPISFGVVLLAGVGVAVSQLPEVRTRSKLLQVGACASLAMGIATFFTALFDRPMGLSGQFGRIGFDVLMAVCSGIGTGMFVQGILPLIEQVFRVTTAMTLKELNDANHPLLKRLAQEAPGTYQHSLRMADMSEAAADAIGANGLLCKVGAMYHDIGKINKPMYFIENQGGGPNRHNKLSPAMSLLIIVGHVKDGIEMAREYGLPPVLRHFIESHHGTTLVEYFYHAARKLKEAQDAPAPAEFEFRYPGPKPQTKEAAIMLLCDSCESATRAMTDPTPVRIEQNVHDLANKRLMDGQFDESNLTLQELHRVEQSIIKTLCATYHGRIAYPKASSDKPGGGAGRDNAIASMAEQASQPASAAS